MLKIERRKRKKKKCCSINSIQNEKFQRDTDQYELNAMQNEVRMLKQIRENLNSESVIYFTI